MLGRSKGGAVHFEKHFACSITKPISHLESPILSTGTSHLGILIMPGPNPSYSTPPILHPYSQKAFPLLPHPESSNPQKLHVGRAQKAACDGSLSRRP